MDVLGKEWSPALSIRTALLSIQALLSAAEPDDPQDAEVANMYKTNREEFVRVAKYWTESYASPNSTEQNANPHQPKIDQIVEMGFTETQAKEALQRNGMKLEEAVQSLLG